MSEVKRYHVTEAGLVEGQALGRINVVLGSDYDTAVAVGTAFGNTLERVVAERDALQQRLTAADERVDVLEGLLREVQKSARKQGWASGYPTLFASVDAALKPVEGGGDEPNCLLCLDKKTVPSNLAKGYVMDCPDCCGEEG